jgi:cystathionine gamma-lyase
VAVDNKFYTRAVHAGTKPEPVTGAIMTPIFQTSTFVQESPGEHKGFDYSRGTNPTRDALQEALAEIESAKYGLAFSSGLAAVQAVVQALLVPGDKVLVCDDVYGGTGRLFRKLFAKYGIEFVFLNMCDEASVKAAITKNTKMLWVETPTNPTMKVIDIRAMVKLGHSVGATVVVDNTFASPVFQQPLALGADIVMHSTTKYIGGHSDIIGGAIMLSNPDMHEKIRFVQFAGGAVPSPLECFLLLRSIKTLAVRMRQHDENAIQVAKFLESHKRVKKVFFPGLESHPQFQISRSQTSGNSGMISFDLDGSYDDVVKMLSKLKIFALAESLGGVESLVNHPERMTHASVPEELRKQLGITHSLLRLSVGIESALDLVQDLKQALDR